MNEKEILSNISERLGIIALKPMQLETAASQSDRIRLAAPTGSGKTIAFVINLLKNMSSPGKGVQGVIIAPSRELILQIAAVVKAASTGYKVVAFYGGHKMEDEKKSLIPVPDIIVATPGRLLDHLNRGFLSLSTAKSLVLDEYDK
ncbi:MAG: DEAD/DEAH box helicase, partial [Paramuribaculum sp.]|nr:DEAD/DEAH box helicase [Paramuribaculum sp.]